MADNSPRPAWPGWLAVLMGGLLCAVATGILPSDERAFHSPRWVLFLCGVIFIAGGAAVLAGPQTRVAAVSAALIALGLGTVGLWIALAGDAAQMSGGLPFLSRESNVLLARVVFGAGGAACYLFAAAIAVRSWKRRKGE